MGDMEQAAIDEMMARARKNMVTHEILQFPLGTEVAGIYLATEPGRPSKKDPTKKPGLIHTMEVSGEKVRFWGFGILDFHLEDNKIQPGDFIIVTRREMNEKKMWTADFGFAKAEGSKNASGKKSKAKA